MPQGEGRDGVGKAGEYDQANQVVRSPVELAAAAGTIPYEFFCGISKRVPRVYLK